MHPLGCQLKRLGHRRKLCVAERVTAILEAQYRVASISAHLHTDEAAGEQVVHDRAVQQVHDKLSYQRPLTEHNGIGGFDLYLSPERSASGSNSAVEHGNVVVVIAQKLECIPPYRDVRRDQLQSKCGANALGHLRFVFDDQHSHDAIL